MFFVGLHHPADSRHFDRAFISVNRVRARKSPIPARDWILDSGAFSTIATHGGYPEPVSVYAAQIRHLRVSGNLLAAVAQDYMCEPWMLEKTGLTIADHQRLTIERYHALLSFETGVYIMPVLQGYAPTDYVTHIRAYGARLAHGAWVGVGSVCKRNSDPAAIENVLLAIKLERPDLRLHGFGLKLTALRSGLVRDLLFSADSMAWSFAARREGRDANSWHEAKRFADAVDRQSFQGFLTGLLWNENAQQPLG
jgi:hypothetical protein